MTVPASAQESTVVTPAPDADTTAISHDRLIWHIPDPDTNPDWAPSELKEAEAAKDATRTKAIKRVIELVKPISRKHTLSLSLEDAIHRTLTTNYSLAVARVNPAVETTRVVEAEAAFDAIFFSNLTKNKVDTPSASQLQATSADILDWTTGIRKLLPTGMQVTGSIEMNRTYTSLVFQGINPQYTTNIVFELDQPLLRGFGIDYNRSLIVVNQYGRDIAEWTFRATVRDLIRRVEEAYWRLVQARRDVVITARLQADFEQILEYLNARRDFDVIPVQLNATQASLEQSRADFVVRVANVFNAEDNLIALMNSKDVNLADDVEIIPTDFPELEPITLDRVGEVQTALNNRPELKEQQLAIKQARVLANRARNEELPRFDLTFRQTMPGLGTNADAAFDVSTTWRFIEYFIGVQLEVPIGNRGPRAAFRRAELQHDSAVALLRQRIEEVVLDVNQAVRQLETSYDQIAPAYQAAEARVREVDSIVARAERKDLNTLNSELNARQALATARRAMLGFMVDYNIAVIDLERAKGTLLKYNNIVVAPHDEASEGARVP
jgi:outer membrane protein